MGAISLKKAEKPVVVAIRTVDPYLVYSAHLAMHGFPLAAAAEGGRRGVRDCTYDCDHRRAHLGRACVEEVSLAGTCRLPKLDRGTGRAGWHRATLEPNVPRTRSLGRRACSAQDPYQSRAGEPGAPAATRSAPPPLEATAVRAPRSRVLGLSLSAVGRLAEGAPRRSPRDRDSLAPAGLSRFLLHGRGLRGLSVEAARGGLGERLHGPPLH